MRYLSIVFFLVCIHVSIAMVNTMHITDPYLAPSQELLDKGGQADLMDEEYTKSQISTDTDGFGDYIFAIFKFIGTFALGVVIIPYTLVKIGIAMPYAMYISIPIYLLYIIAWIQIISKDNYTLKK